MDDLNRAIDFSNLAVESTGQNHYSQAGVLSNLGLCLVDRYEQTGSADDLQRALFSYKNAWAYYNSTPVHRISAAQRASSILISLNKWEEASLLLQQVLGLLPVITPRSLEHTDKQDLLAGFAGLASTAAAAYLTAQKEPSHALQLLELGCDIITGLVMEMRGDISYLQEQYPSLAEEFLSLRDILDSAVGVKPPQPSQDARAWEAQTKRRREADQKMASLIETIHAQL